MTTHCAGTFPDVRSMSEFHLSSGLHSWLSESDAVADLCYLILVFMLMSGVSKYLET